jgi:thymidylate synthase
VLSITDYNITGALPRLARHVMSQGSIVGSRLGEQTRESLDVHLELTRPWEREILLPARAASLPAQIAETMWVLAGRNDVAWLSHYLPRAADFSDDGETWRGGYGPRLRHWPMDEWHGNVAVDQLRWVVDLLRREPETRRAVISIYDPARDSRDGKDIPCNNWLQFIQRDGELHLFVTIRSNDLIWGNAINTFEWSALLEVVAGLVRVPMGPMHLNITSLHIYDRHWEKANAIASDHVAVYQESPRFVAPISVDGFDDLVAQWFGIEEKIRTGSVEEGDVEDFPEPMLQSWLEVLCYHWENGETKADGSRTVIWLDDNALGQAALLSPKQRDPHWEQPGFVEYVSQLHAEKHAAYGDSWKRRGEQMGIMANIARKVDRLGVSGGGDTATDTAVDLLVYLVKYRLWLSEADPEQEVESVTLALKKIDQQQVPTALSAHYLEDDLVRRFASLEKTFDAYTGKTVRAIHVSEMIPHAYDLARKLWAEDQMTDAYQGADHD